MSSGDNGLMDMRRLAAGLVLGLASVAETAARLTAGTTVRAGLGAGPVSHTGPSVPTALLICAFCLASTTPAVVPRPRTAAVAVWLAAVLSIILFDLVTVAGAVALLVVAARLAWDGQRLLAVALSAPFVALALVLTVSAGTARRSAPGLTAAGTETRLLAVLLAAGIPVAALLTVSRRIGQDSRRQSAARALTEGVLAEHLARGERARIARELHDVVAHHISMIAVQAETGRLTTPGLSEAGAQRFAAISDTARAGLTEMRRLLGVLREDAHAGSAAAVSGAAAGDGAGADRPGAGPGGDPRTGPRGVPGTGPGAGRPPADLRPQPGLPQLGDLVDEVRAASACAARLIVSGDVGRLDPGVELAAYRIVQEALTNVRRHAPGAAVDVELRYTPEALLLRIRDNGPGRAQWPDVPAGQAGPAAGLGLTGMRERAAAAGGALRTGNAQGGGFCVEAELPVTAPEILTRL